MGGAGVAGGGIGVGDDVNAVAGGGVGVADGWLMAVVLVFSTGCVVGLEDVVSSLAGSLGDVAGDFSDVANMVLLL